MKSQVNYSIEHIAGILNITNGSTFTMGYKMLFDHLRDLGVFRKVQNKNVPDPILLKQGIFTTVIVTKNGHDYLKTMVTERGLSYFRQCLVPRIKKAEIKYWEKHCPKYLSELECWID